MKRALSRRQIQIAELIRSGKTSRQIGEALFIDQRTVDSHVDAICTKLGVRTRVELVVALFGGEPDVGVEKAPPEPKSNIPVQRTTLIGREPEVAQIVRDIEQNRLLTVCAAGGVGKSRIALAVGEAFRERAKDGVWVIDLAALTNGSFAVATVAQALNVKESTNRSLLESLIVHLKQKTLVLILDNCEHVIDEAAALADSLLRDCPGLRILATSREPLRIAGERTYRLPSLRVPKIDARRIDAAEAAAFAAVALFVDRAKAIDRSFKLGDENAAIVADICQRLDGIPLAIELAAARLDSLSISALSAKLDQRLRLLTNGERTAPARHRTMQALFEWSYDLLAPTEKQFFERLSTFVGGCTLAAAAAVAADGAADELAALDVLSSLVSKSLVATDLTTVEPRYRLLESTRQYASQKLAQRGERDTTALRHALWAASFADDAAELNSSLPRRAWLEKIVPEVNNARAALAWTLGPGSAPTLAARIAVGLNLYWFDRGLSTEGRDWIRRVLGQLDSANPDLTARVWLSLGQLLTGSHQVEAVERATRISENTGNRWQLAMGYLTLAFAHNSLMRFSDGESTSKQALALLQETGNDRSLHYCASMGCHALALVGLGRHDEARMTFEASISLLKALGDEDRAALAQLNLAELERAAGNLPRAIELVEEALSVFRTGGQSGERVDDFFLTAAALNAAAYHIMLGEIDRARTGIAEALTLARRLQVPVYRAIAIQHVATIAALQNEPHLAARLTGFADAVYRGEGSQREMTEQQTYEIVREALKAALRDEDIMRLMAEGALIGEEGAISLALTFLRIPSTSSYHL